MIRWWLALGALALALGCSKSIDGPTPKLTALSNERALAIRPGVVCNAQGASTQGWAVDLIGDDFSPMPTGVLSSTKSVQLPEIDLAGPESYTLPTDRVFFSIKTKLIARFPTSDTSPAKALKTGRYAVTVKNPNGHSGELKDALDVVPPPTITTVTLTAQPAAPSTDGAVTIDGTGFRTGQPPQVVISGSGLSAVTLTNVTVVSATELTAGIPASTAPGTYDVTLTNPEGCAAFAAGALTIGRTLGALSLDPHFGWQLRNQPITVYDTVTNPASQQGFTPGTPTVTLLAPLKTAPGAIVRIPLRRVAYVSENTISAVVPDCSGISATPTEGATPSDCPSGINPGGPYAIEVRDASGITGSIPVGAGFSVLTDPPPTVSTISPNSITTAGVPSSQTPGFLKITGQHFDTASDGKYSKAQIGFEVTGGVEYCDLPTASSGVVSDTELDVNVPASVAAASCVVYNSDGSVNASPSTGFQIKEGEYVIRAQHLGDVGAGDFAALVVTSTSFNPVNGPAISTKLAEPLDDFPLLSATDDLGNSFLYALGGTNAGGATANVELAAISKFGDVGGTCSPAVDGGTPTCTFRQLDRASSPNAHQGQLGVTAVSNTPIAITGATAIARQANETCNGSPCTTTYVFLIGGEDASGAALSTVYRAQVLRNADAPVLDDAATAGTGSLGAGTYYYRVSAITPDPNNPGGETLPSDESVGVLSAAGGLTIQWSCLTGATQYKVYRTVNPDDPAGTEALLDTVNPSCSGSPAKQSYVDSGGKTPAGDTPLAAGSLGIWLPQPDLLTARSHAKAVLVGDDLYVAGGSCTAGSTGCTTAGDLASVEQITFPAGSADLTGLSFQTFVPLQVARSHMDALLAITSGNAPTDVSSGDTYLLAVGGTSNGTLINGAGNPVLEMFQLGSAASSFSTPTYSSSQTGSQGGWAEFQADNLFVYGANTATSLLFDSTTGGVCKGGAHPCPVTNVTDFSFGLNSPGFTPPFRYLPGENLFRAYIYIAGGASKTSGGTLSDTLERLVY